MIQPKVQQVLDELEQVRARIREEALDNEDAADLSFYVLRQAEKLQGIKDRLQSALEEVQQERQTIIDAAREDGWNAALRVVASWHEKCAREATDSDRKKFHIISADGVRALIGQPPDEAKGR